MKRDLPNFEELRQDRVRHWRWAGKARDARYEQVQEVLRHQWRCITCGKQNTSESVCPKCRSARIVEL